MKRLYACALILLCIFLLTWYSGRAVRRFSEETGDFLETAQSALSRGESQHALDTLNLCVTDFREREHLLSFFLSRDSLAALDVTLCAAQIYTQEQNTEEALAELRRAESQVYAVSHLFFRPL